MTITLDDLGFLSSDAGALVLDRLANEDLGDDHTLKLITSLRRDLSLQQAGASLELARLRKKAVSKFGDDASKMYFTKDALEQASDPLIRQRRASMAHFSITGRVLDVCCGIGSDTLSFVREGFSAVTGIDLDPVKLAMARLNAEALGLEAYFEVVDARELDPVADLIFYDPARRDSEGSRIFDVTQYQPPLSLIEGWRSPLLLAKLSPGVDLEQVARYGGVEFISVRGALKEALLWRVGGKYNEVLVPLGYPGMGKTKATLITGTGDELTWSVPRERVNSLFYSEPRGWLIEPDPALIRAGLVAEAAQKFDGFQLDPEIAYITSFVKPESPWVRAWKINDWMPFNLKKLRAYLRERNVGTVTVKKRGTAVTPEELIAKLKLNKNDNGSRTIVLSRCRGDQIALVCDDLTIEGGG